MDDKVSDHILRKCVAKILQEAGFTSAGSIALYLLTDLLKSYIEELIMTAGAMSYLTNQTCLNLGHIAYAFERMGIRLSDMREHIDYFGESSSVSDVSQYPVRRPWEIFCPEPRPLPELGYASDDSDTVSIPESGLVYPSPSPPELERPFSPQDEQPMKVEAEQSKKRKRKKTKKDRKKHKEERKKRKHKHKKSKN